jgi:hypothetical protein
LRRTVKQTGLLFEATMDKISEFIKRRWAQDSHFLDGNCLYFSYILKIRFPFLQIYYLPITGHFCAGYEDNFYDWTGKISLTEKPLLFEDIKKTDTLWYSRLERDCLL